MKKYTRILLLTIMIIIPCLFAFNGCTNKAGQEIEVTYSIIGPNKEDYILKDYVVDVRENTSVYEGLAIICKENKIPMSSIGTGGTTYVQGINSIFEFDEGPESGWMYRVNGEFPDKSSGAVKLNSGDVVHWVYTKELGEDWK